MQEKSKRKHQHSRQGATIFLMLILLVIVFIFVAFAVDVGRIQLAQLKLQTSADFAARAGAEAMSRGVGDTSDLVSFEAAIREEANMLMQKNSLFGAPVTFDANARIQFAVAVQEEEAFDPGASDGPGNGNGNGNGNRKGKKFTVSPNTDGRLQFGTNAITVNPDISQFPLVFGRFLGQDSVALAANSTAKVTDRDIVVVVDRSHSMFDHDAGTATVAEYPPSLMELEDQLYDEGNRFFRGPDSKPQRHSEFEIANGVINLSKIQAMKLALLKFRDVIDSTAGDERLGLTSYAGSAHSPSDASTTNVSVDVAAGLSQTTIQELVDAPDSSSYATDLEGPENDYDNFDYNYLGIRLSSKTNISAGITKGAEILFGPGHRSIARPVLLVMTDGRHTDTNPGDAATPLAAAENAIAAHPDMLIYTVTFGDNANQDAMIDVADEGKGKHFHANEVGGLIEIFQSLAANAGIETIE